MFRVLRMIHLIDVVHPCLSGSIYHGQSKTNVMAVTHNLNVIGTVLRGLERMCRPNPGRCSVRRAGKKRPAALNSSTK